MWGILAVAGIVALIFLAYRKWGHILWYLEAFLRLRGHAKRFATENLTVADMFEQACDLRPHKRYLFFEGGCCYTFSQVDEMANLVCSWALSTGLQKGDVVALLLGNRPEFMFLWLGLCKAGIKAAFINTHLKAEPLLRTIHTSGAKRLIVGAECLAGIAEHSQELRGLAVGGGRSVELFALQDRRLRCVKDCVDVNVSVAEDGLGNIQSKETQGLLDTVEEGDGARGSEVDVLPPPAFADLSAALEQMAGGQPGSLQRPARTVRASIGSFDPAFYIYTSGTTGLPKAAIVPHAKFFLAGASFSIFHGLKESDRLYLVLPMYHSSAGMIGVSTSWFCGASILVKKRFSARSFFPDCKKYGCTVVQYIGQVCRYLVNSPHGPHDRDHGVTKAIGNGMNRETCQQFQRRFAIPYVGEFYGSTEGNASLTCVHFIKSPPGAVGYIPWIAKFFYPVKIVRFSRQTMAPERDARGRCIECGPGEAGELVGLIKANDALRSFAGYTDKEASERKTLRDVFKVGDAWFSTGDLVKKDSDGFVFFVDRIGDTFRWKGENVSTCEVEEVLAAFPGLEEVCVFGVSVPGYEGKAGMAVVQLSSDESKGEQGKGEAPKNAGGLITPQNLELDPKELYKHLHRHLAGYQQPLFVRVSTSLSMTGTFKHRKADMAKQGYDPTTAAGEALLWRNDRATTFQPLDARTYHAIKNAGMRF